MYIAWYGKIVPSKIGGFAEWWMNKENLGRVRNSMTEGMRFVGIYFVILQTDSHDVEMWYEMDNWEVLDRDRFNKKFDEINNELYEKLGNFYEWRRMKVMRSPEDTIVD